MVDRRDLDILTMWIMRKYDIGQLGCWTSLIRHFGNSKFLDKQDVGPATLVHINGCLDACKCTEIFRKNLHLKVYKC